MNDADTAHPMSLAAPLTLFFAAFFAIPLLLLLWVSLQGAEAPGMQQYARFFADGLGARVLTNT